MKLCIRDLGSSHGTKINGTKLINEHELQSGDILEFSKTMAHGSDTICPTSSKSKTLPNHSLSTEEAPKAPKATAFVVNETDRSDGYIDIYYDEDKRECN